MSSPLIACDNLIRLREIACDILSRTCSRSHPIFSHLNPTPPISTETCFSRKMSWPQFINSLTHQLNNWILLPIGPGRSSSKRELPGPIGTYRELSGPKLKIPHFAFQFPLHSRTSTLPLGTSPASFLPVAIKLNICRQECRRLLI